jgi:hypothetical protein
MIEINLNTNIAMKAESQARSHFDKMCKAHAKDAGGSKLKEPNNKSKDGRTR